MKINNIWTIARKELKGFFDGPVAYVVLLVFMALWEYLFFRTVFLVGDASVRIMLDSLPWLMLVLAAAMTMGSLTSEKSGGTLELLLTRPLSVLELLVGKFVAGLVFVGLATAPLMVVATSLSRYGNLDWGVVAGQYVASVMLGSVLVALGIMVSSWFESQVVAMLVSVAASFGMLMAGTQMVTMSLPGPVVVVLSRLSLLTHFESMARGVIDVRDVVYWLSAVGIFLTLAFVSIVKIKFGNRMQTFQRYMLAGGMVVAIVVMVNILGGRIPGRIDLTQGRVYTLSPATKEILQNLPDVVNVKLYASSQVPVQMQPIVRDTKDMLTDYVTASNGKVKVSIFDPSGNSQVENEAQNLGIQPVQFNVVGQEELQLKQGYLGLAILYGGDWEVLPIITGTNDLEYQLTSDINKLTTKDKKTVGFLTGHGEKSVSTDYSTWDGELRKQFNVKPVSLTEESPEIPADVDVLVVAGPSGQVPESDQQAVKQYVDNGGAVLWLLAPVRIDQQTLTASANLTGFEDLLASYGINLQTDLVYDLRSNEMVNFGGPGGVNFVVPYPFWPRVITQKTSPITAKIDSLVLPWASSLEVNADTLKSMGYMETDLMVTSKYAGKQVTNFNISPRQELDTNLIDERLMGVAITGSAGANGKMARMVVVGNADLLADGFVNNQPNNLGFGIEAVSWLGQEQSLAGIQLKTVVSHKMVFANSTDRNLVKYGNLAVVILVPGLYGLWRLYMRRNLRFRRYES